jgi:hypothetical protein
METLKNTREAIQEYVDGLSNDELIYLHNTYCQNAGSCDDEIYNNDEDFFETYFGNAMEAVRAVAFGDYNYSHDYIIFNGYGNLETFNGGSAEDHIDKDCIIDAILESPEDYDIELEAEEFECPICNTTYDSQEEADECEVSCRDAEPEAE